MPSYGKPPDENAPLLYTFLPRSDHTPSRGRYDSFPISPRSSFVKPNTPPSRAFNRRLDNAWRRGLRCMGMTTDYEWPWAGMDSRAPENGLIEERGWVKKEKGRGREDVPPDALVLPLLIITFSCAMADSGTLVSFQTFATSMTGNTVFLALSAFGLSKKPPIYATASLLTFIVAGLIAGQLGGVLGHRRRSWLLSSVGLQILILCVAAWSVSPFAPISTRQGGTWDWIYLLLVGLQGGPQVVMATNAGVRELPTAMMTTPYAAFISDPSLFAFCSLDTDKKDTISRNRRALYIALFWAGAFSGAALMKWSTLWILTLVVAGLKVFAACLIWLACGEVKEEGLDGGVEEEVIEDSPLESSWWSQTAHHKRASSVFDTLSRQKPRDERHVAM